MNQRTTGILNRILSGESKKPKDAFTILTRLHHDFMKEYGWISPDEFYELPMDFINNMVQHINHDRKEENKQMKKANKGRR